MTTPIPSKGSAVVTGAAHGIGRAIALRLARDGYDVAVNDLPVASEGLEAVTQEIRSQGRKAIAVTGDVSQEEVVQMLVDRTVEELGDLYVMVANAAIGTPSGPLVKTSLETWERYLSINVTSVFLCYRAAARQMLKQGRGGRIIGASSAFGKRGWGNVAAYSTTKFAVRGLTQALATELATSGITVNAYAPGYVDTGFVPNSIATPEGKPIITDKNVIDSQVKILMDLTPMNKMGTPEDIAGLVSYIVSDEANFATGQSFSINGGLFYD